MTQPPTKTCRACSAILPIDQFRLIPPRQPGRAPSRYYRCRVCEREIARLRAAHLYNTDEEFRAKRIANAIIQRKRQEVRRRGTE